MNSTNDTWDKMAIAEAVRAERLALCDFLEQLEPDEWEAQSSCSDWTVQDVVAHLTLATLETVRRMIIELIKARGKFDRMNTNMAVERSRGFDPAELIQQLRASADSSRRNPMSSPTDQLIDVLVHAQDIARPLGRTFPMKSERVVPALDHAINSRWYGGAKRFVDVHLVATDTDWSSGSGSLEVEGAVGDLLLVATGRSGALAALAGPGVAGLTRQLAT